MKSQAKPHILFFAVLFLSIFLLLMPPTAFAQAKSWLQTPCVGQVTQLDISSGAANPTADGTNVATIQGFQCLIGNVLSIALTGLTLIGFIMFIIAGFSYMVSGGNAKGTEAAKNMVTYAVIGLVVALSAFIVLNLLASFTGVQSILQFSIPKPGVSPVGLPK